MALPGVNPVSTPNWPHSHAKTQVMLAEMRKESIPVTLADLASCTNKPLQWVLCTDGLEHAYCTVCGEEIKGYTREVTDDPNYGVPETVTAGDLPTPEPEIYLIREGSSKPYVPRAKRKWSFKWR